MLIVRKAEINMYRKPRYFKIRNVVTWQAVALRQSIDPTGLQPKVVANAIAR